MFSAGGRLKEFMKAKDITQKMLAEQSCIAQSSISRMINNEQPITLSLLEYLHFKYKLNPAFFIDESVQLKNLGTQNGHSGDINNF